MLYSPTANQTLSEKKIQKRTKLLLRDILFDKICCRNNRNDTRSIGKYSFSLIFFFNVIRIA